MKKFDGILLISDLDGTLLKGDKSISEENIKAIEYFKSNGGIFTFITGRVPVAAVPVYEVVKVSGPDHSPSFTIEVFIEGYARVSVTGTSKRNAEQSAATHFLEMLELTNNRHK